MRQSALLFSCVLATACGTQNADTSRPVVPEPAPIEAEPTPTTEPDVPQQAITPPTDAQASLFAASTNA